MAVLPNVPVLVFGRTRLGAEAFTAAIGACLHVPVQALSGPLADLLAAVPEQGATVVLLPPNGPHAVAARALLADHPGVRVVEAERWADAGLRALIAELTGAKPQRAPAVTRFGTRRPAPDPVASLTRRQQQMLELLASGASDAEAAATMGVSVRTLSRHVASIARRLASPGDQGGPGPLGGNPALPLSVPQS